MEKNRFDLKVIFWGYTNVLCFNWSASYMDIYIYQTVHVRAMVFIIPV